MLKELKAKIGQNLHNLKGWRTPRKIVVIESDDWGSIRMPSKTVFDQLTAQGYPVGRDSFARVDSLASETDLQLLFDLLQKHRDKNGRPAVFTANVIVANPDFDQIRDSDFATYHYELFTQTLQRYPEHRNSFALWKQGMSSGVFHPQLHGREHLNVSLWMQFLQAKSPATRTAFDLGLFALNPDIAGERRPTYMAAFDYTNSDELTGQADILQDAQREFEALFGYKSRSFIAPNYVWHPTLEQSMKDCGIAYIQSSRSQLIPQGKGQYEYRKHHTGEKNKSGQTYLVRNAIFEPAAADGKKHVEVCLSQMRAAFRWHKPVIISSHRLNYMGFIDPDNRRRNLALLDELLTQMLRTWPDIEFMTSDQLGDLITATTKKH